ncbi:MAG: hypothetical protein C0475_02575 [Planctomyces sp.]|nr:hypothetical protein [Planctomyces sp.]
MAGWVRAVVVGAQRARLNRHGLARKSRVRASAVDIQSVKRHADDVLVILDGSVGSLVCGWREGACVDPSRVRMSGAGGVGAGAGVGVGAAGGGGARRVIGFVTAAARAGSSDPFDQFARLGGVCRLDGMLEMAAPATGQRQRDGGWGVEGAGEAAGGAEGAGTGIGAGVGGRGNGGEEGQAHIHTDVLIAAARAAARLGIGRVVWAVAVGSGAGLAGRAEIDAVADAYDRAVLVSGLVSLEHPEMGPAGVRIETPLLDLSPDQVMDLALDLDAPLELLGGIGAASAG